MVSCLKNHFLIFQTLIGYYGIGEFSGIRMIGSVDQSILPDDRIRISQVGIKDNKLNLEFSKIKVKRLK